MSFAFQPSPTRKPSVLDAPANGLDFNELVSSLANRVAQAEKRLDLAVDEQSLARIILTERDITMLAEKVTIVGELNMFSWLQDMSGVDPRSGVTQIRGGKIKTGIIESTNWSTTTGSAWNLETGEMKLGGSTAPKIWLKSDGSAEFSGTVTASGFIDGSAKIAGTSTMISTVASNASYGATRSVGDVTATILANSATAVTVTSSNLFTMPGTGSASLQIGAGGIIGKNAAGLP